MFAIALIVFRESLEASLLVGIVAAATRGLAGRSRWLGAGVAVGALGAVALALAARQLSGWLDGLGQDFVEVLILSFALVMLLWHCVWVGTHAQQMVGGARRLGQSVQQGQRPPWALLAVVALAVLREGAETVLFVGGAAVGGGGSGPGQVLAAGALGLGAGVLSGALMYAGLARIPTRRLFAVTNVLIALLAASLGSQLARTLAQAGWLEAGSATLWDSSHLLAPDSALGSVLHALAGYDPQPSAAQLLSYAGTLALIVAGVRFLGRRPIAARTR